MNATSKARERVDQIGKDNDDSPPVGASRSDVAWALQTLVRTLSFVEEIRAQNTGWAGRGAAELLDEIEGALPPPPPKRAPNWLA